MAIIDTITSEYEFWNWLKSSGGYRDNFSLEGAKTVQDYYEQLSDDMGENIEFDPIAWCCEWSEYDSLKEACEQYDSYFDDGQSLDDYTTVLTLDNGHVLIQEF